VVVLTIGERCEALLIDVRVALAADSLVTVVLGGEGLEGGLDDTTAETEDEVKSGLLLSWETSCQPVCSILRIFPAIFSDIMSAFANLLHNVDGLPSYILHLCFYLLHHPPTDPISFSNFFTLQLFLTSYKSYLLDVVVGKSATVLKLLAGKDQTLLVWGDSFLVLDLALDIVNGVAGLDLKGDGLARQGLDENLHLDGVLKS